MLVLEGLVGLHRTIQLQLQHWRSGPLEKIMANHWSIPFLPSNFSHLEAVSLSAKQLKDIQDLAPKLLLSVSPRFHIPSLP